MLYQIFIKDNQIIGYYVDTIFIDFMLRRKSLLHFLLLLIMKRMIIILKYFEEL